jgi:hypothetical protein
LTNLTVAALCTVPFAEGLEKAVADTVWYPSDAMAQVLGLLCGGPLPLLLIINLHRDDLQGWLTCRRDGLADRLRWCVAACLLPVLALLRLVNYVGETAWAALRRCLERVMRDRLVGCRRVLLLSGLVLIGLTTCALSIVVLSE